MSAASFARWSWGGGRAPGPSRAHVPAAALATGLVLSLIALGVPAEAPGLARPTAGATASSPMREAGRIPSLDPDQPTELDRQIRSAQMQLRATQIQVAELSARRDQITTELAETRAEIAQATTDLKQAKSEEAGAETTASSAAESVADARTARSDALEVATAAREAMTEATDHLGDLAKKAAAAATAVERAADRVESARAGSAAHRIAFTSWQMAAVADRAAHARHAIAEDLGAGLFTELHTAEAALADAEIALGDARGVQDEAERVARDAPQRIADLRAVRLTALAEVHALDLEAASVESAEHGAIQAVSRLTARITELTSRAAQVGRPQAVARAAQPAAGGAS